MNKRVQTEGELAQQVLDILLCLKHERFSNQRLLAEKTGMSLGFVNKAVSILEEAGLIDKECLPTAKARSLFQRCKPQRAVILAAGFSWKLGPINSTTSAALLEIRGEILIERQIEQLHEAGITDISIVVGFMKERFDYLVDKYGVKLLYNDSYAVKNNIYSVSLASAELSNCYLIPSDIWSENNPYRSDELFSWYMVSDGYDAESSVRVNRKNELILVAPGEGGNRMIGIAYLLDRDADIVRANIKDLLSDGKHNGSYWEEALYDGDRMTVHARLSPDGDHKEITTFEQYQDVDLGSNRLKDESVRTIMDAFGCSVSDITDVSVLKKGMTNRSFLFTVKGTKYILRVPGEGTDHIINRKQEAAVFKAIRGTGLCDDPVFIDAESGYKITRYLEGIRVCDTGSEDDLKKCMDKLRSFHEMKLKVDHEFDIFEKICFYESLWNGMPSIFRDYHETKEKIISLRDVIKKIEKDKCLTHIDAVSDNFLFFKPDGSAEECLQLTDWEYAGMQDPHVDIAMFCIYSLFDKERCDQLIDIYFNNKCDTVTRGKIYCYIASCGLLWSNWCEYKRQLGVEFGEYSVRQYRYAKEFYKYAGESL